MAQAQRQFQDPAYVARQSAFLGPVAAGSGGVTTKFTAHANLLLFDLTTYTITLGTSTYTNTVTGTGTATASGQQVNVITIVNTSTTTTVALATTTYGPFLAGGQGSAGQVGGSNQFVLNTTTGTGGYGGILIPQGSLFYVVSGTDATAVTNCTIGYQINTGAGLTV